MGARRWSALAMLILTLVYVVGCGGSTAGNGPSRSAPPPPTHRASASQALPTLTVGYNAITPSALPFLLAKAKGLFAKERVQVHLRRFLQGGAIEDQALAAGQIDIAAEAAGPDTVVRMATKGAHIKMVATEETLDPTWMYAKPGIGAVAQLKGKTVVVGGFGGPLYTYGILMLRSGKLGPKNVKLIENGNNQQRVTLLTSGQADAAILSLPGNFVAQKAGFHKLVFLGNVLKSAVLVWVVGDRTLQKDRVGVVRFLRAILDAQQLIRQHPHEAAAVYAKVTKTSTSLALRSIRIYTPYYGWQIHMSQLMRVFRTDREVGIWKQPMPSVAQLRSLTDASLIAAIK